MKFLSGQTKKYLFLAVVLVLVTVATSLNFSSPVRAAGFDLSNPALIADIAERSSPAVVWIVTTYENQDSAQRSFNSQPKKDSQGIGSGFFFHQNGSILTNAHVVAGAKLIEVTLIGQKKLVPATLVGIDRDLDVAVLKVDLPNKVPYLKFGNSEKARIGEWVVAIGNPYGLDHTVTIGIISAKGRPLVAGEGSGNSQSYENMIQTDAAINPGNSGGPLLNLRNEVIGINTAVVTTGQGLGFAIPINSIQGILDELITKGKVSHAWLGVYMLDLRIANSRVRAKYGLNKFSDGVLIDPVSNSPAANVGLRAYDLILAFNNQPVTNSNDLISFIKKQKVGDKVSLTVFRNGSQFPVEVVLEEKPEE